MIKLKKCKICNQEFKQYSSSTLVCSVQCAITLGKEKNLKKYKAETRRLKRGLNLRDKRHQLRLAQPAFNSYIRERDKDENCISCGRSNNQVAISEDWNAGGVWDCGHFLTIGGFPELRFEETNAHKQCKVCNSGSHHHAKKKRTVSESYRLGLIERIGLDKVLWLEGLHEPKHYSVDDIVKIKKEYRKKTRQLQLEAVE